MILRAVLPPGTGFCKPRASGDDPVRSASAHLSTL